MSTIPFWANAQVGKEAWNWNFGYNVGLNFSSGNPVEINSSLATGEGCATISDVNTGQLLFYTDGRTIWNRNNAPMPNGFGLLGDNSTTQSALIVPKPGNKNLYYVLAAPREGGYAVHPTGDGICYSIVDMTLSGGYGDVILKNQLLTAPPVTEKLLGVRHCNGRDYWILTHPFNSDAFNAYHVSSAGIDTIPVVSHVGTLEQNYSGYGLEAIGYLKASPNGKKLALGIWSEIPILEIYDFDNATGIVSNPIKKTYSNNYNHGAYGLSFSPDNTKLYATVRDSELVDSYIYQYDLSSGIASQIFASETLIFHDTIDYGVPAALQLGPDGKIYACNNYEDTAVGVISNPNNLGLSCNFKPRAVHLNNSVYTEEGLPNFIDGGLPTSNYIPSKTVSVCGYSIYDTLKATPGYGSYHWSTGDTSSYVIITNPGIYWVTMNSTGGCSLIDTIKVNLIAPPAINILHDTSICSNTNKPITINATYPGAVNYLWNDNTTLPIHTINIPGLYYVTFKLNNGCVSVDSFHYVVHTLPTINLPKDTSVCTSTYTITETTNYSYNWNTGDTTNQIIINTTGQYWVNIMDSLHCKTTDTINIKLNIPPTINVLRDTIVCSNTHISLTFNAFYPNTTTYLWSDGKSGIIDTISNPGLYWVNYTFNNGCSAVDSFNLKIDSIPKANLGRDTSLCSPSYNISVQPGYEYIWSTGATSQQITVTNTGSYWVKVITTDGACKNSDTVNITLYSPPIINYLTDSIECGNTFNPITITANYPNVVSYNWSDGFVGQTHTLISPGNYWITYLLNTTCIATDSFNLLLNPFPIVYLGNDTSFCQGDITLNAKYPAATYLWNTGATTSTITAQTGNSYWVKVAANGCVAISDTLTIKPQLSVLDFIMPNIVTPNNDGLNDYIDFDKYQFLTMQLEIYNRWGTKIIEITNPNFIWKPIEEDGIYFYILQFKINCGTQTNQNSLKGFITIIR